MPAELATTRLAIQMISFSYKGMKVVTIPGEKPAGFGSLTWLFSLWKLALFRLNSHSRMTNATKLTEIGVRSFRMPEAPGILLSTGALHMKTVASTPH